MSSQVQDSPTGWVRKHIDEYVASDGDQGHIWNGAPTLLLTTTGRKTGAQHRTALIYGRDGEDYLLVGSQGGAPKHPNWYLNLVANPEVTLQVESEVFAARARTAEPDERARLWPTMTAHWPDFDNYQQRPTGRSR